MLTQQYLVWKRGPVLVVTDGDPTHRVTVKMTPERVEHLMALARQWLVNDRAAREAPEQTPYRVR